MVLDYIYHSGFGFEFNDVTIIIDYFKDSSETEKDKGIVHDYLLQKPGKLYVLCTHIHPDHFNPEILNWRKTRPDIIYIFSRDILVGGKTKENDAVYLDKGESYEDANLKVMACGSTDVGVSFLMHINGKSIFHAGDLNNWNWCDESTQEEIDEANNDFLKELDDIQKLSPTIDMVLFPVDPRQGSDYMKGDKQFVEHIKASVFVPMHFGENYSGGDAFKSFAERKGCRFITITHRGQRFDITI